jgi:hypothetical protein
VHGVTFGRGAQKRKSPSNVTYSRRLRGWAGPRGGLHHAK